MVLLKTELDLQWERWREQYKADPSTCPTCKTTLCAGGYCMIDNLMWPHIIAWQAEQQTTGAE